MPGQWNQMCFKLKAYRLRDSDQEKLIISDLGNITDPDFGTVDRIHGILDKADFENKDQATIYLSSGSEEETRNLRENIERADPELLKRIQFIRSLDSTAARQQQEDDDTDVDQGVDADNLENFKAPESIVMDSKTLARLMGEDPKKNFLFIKRSEKYKTVIKRLDNYHSRIDEFRKSLEKAKDDGESFETANKEMKELTDSLIEAIDAYTSSSKTKDTDNVKDAKKDAMQALKDQALLTLQVRDTKDLNNPKKYIHRDIEALRMQRWSEEFKPLLDSQLTAVPGSLLGVGAQGPVYSKVYSLPNNGGPPVRFEAAIKLDDITKNNQEGVGSGIAKKNPEQSKRAVATYQINRLLGMDVIPKTEFMMRRNDRGDAEFGQAMELVEGIEGQVEVKLQDLSKEQAEGLIEFAIAGQEPPPDIRLNIANGTGYRFENRIVNADTSNPTLQRGLSDLQLLDNIIGHADRHPGNYIIEYAGDGDNKIITGVMGIDNDDTFGKKWATSDKKTNFTFGSKTTGLPPVLDVNTVLSLIDTNPLTIARMHGTLNNKLEPKEIQATMDRFLGVLDSLPAMIEAGNVAASPGEILSQDQLKKLADFAGMDTASVQQNMKTWGRQIEGMHDKQNSYLGDMKQRIQDEQVVEF